MDMKFRLVLLCGAAALAFAAVAQAPAATDRKTNISGLDTANFDTSVRACDDFYQYSNGTWLKNNEIPAAYRRWGAFNEVNERNEALVREIIEAATANENAAQGSNQQKIGDFHASAMDTDRIEAAGITPLAGDLERIAAVSSLVQLQEVIAGYHLEGVNPLFDLDILEDLKNNTRYLVYTTQGGLGLPDRDYYLKDDDDSVTLREKYLTHVANMLQLLGDSEEDAKAGAEAVMAIETALAAASLTRVETRDPNNLYELVQTAEIDAKAVNFSWAGYFERIGLEDISEFSQQPGAFFGALDTLLAERPLADLKTYVRWNLIHEAAPFLSSAFVNENFAFYGTALRGTKELLPRWKRALRAANQNLGEALGRLFVERAFSPEHKERALELVANLRAALRERLMNLDWMSDETKQRALAKLAAFTPKIGYPDEWRDYSKLHIERGLYIDNVRRGAAFEIRRNLDKIGKPIDKKEWQMNAHTVNAYYDPLKNEIVFPAGILQPPFFDGEIDDAVNYGAFGAVIGHEMLHGFDDQGSKFDAQGNLNNWWTDDDRKRFEDRTDRLVGQFDGYVAVDDLHVNGKLTLGENIGDFGGLTVAFAAFQQTLAAGAPEKIDGLTAEQRFFLAWSQVWRANYRPEAVRLLVKTDPHAPSKFRVIGPLTNMASFYEAFGCKPGDGMVGAEDDRVKIW